MSDNWVVENLESALSTWDSKMAEVWSLLTMSPQSFKRRLSGLECFPELSNLLQHLSPLLQPAQWSRYCRHSCDNAGCRFVMPTHN